MSNTRRMSCKNKQNQYSTAAEANRAMKDFYARNFGGLRTNTSVYPCGNHFHWGHHRGTKR